MSLRHEVGSGFGYVFELDGNDEPYISALEEVLGVPRDSADQDLNFYVGDTLFRVPDIEKVLDMTHEDIDHEERDFLVVYAPGSRVKHTDSPTEEERQAAAAASVETEALTKFAEALRERGMDVPAPAITYYESYI